MKGPHTMSLKQSDATFLDRERVDSGRPAWKAHPGARFEIRDYDRYPPFASFLPGIAGPEGAPLWCMYVNRGQGVCSFGVDSKDQAIAEFFPATSAYRLAGLYGFRTFIADYSGIYHEPFSNHQGYGSEGHRCMLIEPHALTLRDENHSAGWAVEVQYFSVVNSPTPALCRRLKVRNLHGNRRHVRIADGLPVIVPAGVSDIALKKVRRITEGFVRVRQHDSGAAMYALPASMQDSSEVQEIQAASFFGGWTKTVSGQLALPLAVDPDALFMPGSDFILPEKFVSNEVDLEAQNWNNRLPCGFALYEGEVGAEESVEIFSYSGVARNHDLLDSFISEMCIQGCFDIQEAAARSLVQEITRPAVGYTSSLELNGYLVQNYLDNVLRGGIPYVMPSVDGVRPLHLYARRHGDMERDYNEFRVPANPLSEGIGNYRDILQNRRHDCWLYPEVGTGEIRAFLELIQPDGYNPLGVEGFRWQLPNEQTALEHCPSSQRDHQETFVRLTTEPFAPGMLMQWLNDNLIRMESPLDWVNDVLQAGQARLSAVGDEDGYWSEHWCYLTDMIEAWRALHPSDLAGLLDQVVGWFEPEMRVLTEGERRTRREGGKLRLYGALRPRGENDRRSPWPEVSVRAKLVALAAIKAMTLDPEGRGLEMEAGRPCWNDALNGLPGLFGSSLCETAELARLVRLLREYQTDLCGIELPVPAAELVTKAVDILKSLPYDWHSARQLREDYRLAAYESTETGLKRIDGKTITMLLERIESTCLAGIEASRIAGSPLIHTYYMRDGVVPEDCDDLATFDRSAIGAQPLPLFLEGQVHLLRLVQDKEEAEAIYKAVRASTLYDIPLGMLMLNENLDPCTQEIGRARTFSRGIYENESIWLHMSYKFLVELLRHQLVEEFYDEARTMLVPFMEPEKYGRSIFENSSFLASSSCPEAGIHGRGFVARLSGSTAEFIHIWLCLTVGYSPFRETPEGLVFELDPALPGEWFTTEESTIVWNGNKEVLPENSLAFCLFGKILCVYHNQSRRHTRGDRGVSVCGYEVDGARVDGKVITGGLAQKIRDRLVDRIDVWLD